MISEKLRTAREYELAHEKDILPEERPAFHLSPRVSWLNDPNGMADSTTCFTSIILIPPSGAPCIGATR